jgi:hypothetical protein
MDGKNKSSTLAQAYKSVFNAKNLASIDSNIIPNSKHHFTTERSMVQQPPQDYHLNISSSMSNQNKSLLLPSLLNDHYNTSIKEDWNKKNKFFSHVLKSS